MSLAEELLDAARSISEPEPVSAYEAAVPAALHLLRNGMTLKAASQFLHGRKPEAFPAGWWALYQGLRRATHPSCCREGGGEVNFVIDQAEVHRPGQCWFVSIPADAVKFRREAVGAVGTVSQSGYGSRDVFATIPVGFTFGPDILIIDEDDRAPDTAEAHQIAQDAFDRWADGYKAADRSLDPEPFERDYDPDLYADQGREF